MLVPQVRVVRCAPQNHPCPHCGTNGRRKRPLHRRIRSLAFRQVAYLDVHYAFYQARCSCCKFFRSWPLDVPPKADDDALVRTAVRSPHPRRRPQPPPHAGGPETRLLPEAIGGLRLRLSALEGGATRPVGASATVPLPTSPPRLPSIPLHLGPT